MTKPYTLQEQQSQSWFKPKHRIGFLFGMTQFDACWKQNKHGNLIQVYGDLPSAKTDCETMKSCLEKFEILEEDIIDCSNNPSADEVANQLELLSKRIRAGKKKCWPIENFLIIFIFAGHGCLKNGMQMLLYNEYNPRIGFYKMLAAEAKLRTWAEIYPNAYVIGIFACCRQLYDDEQMSGCISKQMASKYLIKEETDDLAPVHLTTFNQQVHQYQMAYERFKQSMRKFQDGEFKHKQAQIKETIKKQLINSMKRIRLRRLVHIDEPVRPLRRINTMHYGYCAERLVQNFCFIFGNKPSRSLLAESTMVTDITDLMTNDFNHDTLSLKIPECFNYFCQKKGDAKFETVMSNSLHPLNMIYSHNIVTKTIAYIFINDTCRGLPVKNVQDRGNKAIEFFQGILEFQDVYFFHNLTKHEVIEKLNELKQIAVTFEEDIAQKEKDKQTSLKVIPVEVAATWKLLKREPHETMDFQQAFRCTNLIAQKLGSKAQSKQKFKDDFARLDFDGDGDVTLQEMIRYETNRMHHKKLFLAGICWIGRSFGESFSRSKEILEGKVKIKPSLEDKTTYLPWFELNHLGQPICLNEYATEIASGPNTHIIQLDDFDPEAEHLTAENIDTEGEFQEKCLERRLEGRKRHTFVYQCNISRLVVLFSTQKSSSQVLAIPYSFKLTNMSLQNWKQVSNREEIFLDLRTEIDKANVRLNRPVNTFRKTQCNVWQDQPKLVQYEQCYERNWHPSVHNIENQSQIVHITGDVDDENQIMLIFFNSITLIELSRVPLDMEHFTSAMIVNENRSQVQAASSLAQVLLNHLEQIMAGTFYLVLFTHNESATSCRLYKFFHEGKTNQWRYEMAKKGVQNSEKKPAGFLNAFRICRNKQDQILLATKYRFLVFNADLEQINEACFSDFDPQTNHIVTFNQGKNGYLFGFKLNTASAKEKKIKRSHTYVGERNFTDSTTWIVRCSIHPKSFAIQCSEEQRQKKSLLLIDEVVYTVLEYATDKMIVSLALTNLLIVNRWKPLKLILRNSPNNIEKYFFAPLPGFDEQKFPFIACSGFEHISLVDVKDLSMQIFVRIPCKSVKSQQAFFFKEEKYGCSMHFSSKEIQEGNKELHKWHQLELKQDFDKLLRLHSILPLNCLEAKQQMADEIEQYKMMKQELFPDKCKGDDDVANVNNLQYKKKKSKNVEDMKRRISVALNPNIGIQRSATLSSFVQSLNNKKQKPVHSGSLELSTPDSLIEEKEGGKLQLQLQSNNYVQLKSHKSEQIQNNQTFLSLRREELDSKSVSVSNLDDDSQDSSNSSDSDESIALSDLSAHLLSPLPQLSEAIQEVDEEITPKDDSKLEPSFSNISQLRREEGLHGLKDPQAKDSHLLIPKQESIPVRHTKPKIKVDLGKQTIPVKVEHACEHKPQLAKIEELLGQHGKLIDKLVQEQKQMKEESDKKQTYASEARPIKAMDIQPSNDNTPIQRTREPQKSLRISCEWSDSPSNSQIISHGKIVQNNTESLHSSRKKKKKKTKGRAQTPSLIAYQPPTNQIKTPLTPQRFHQLATSKHDAPKRRPNSMSGTVTRDKAIEQIGDSVMFQHPMIQINVIEKPIFQGITSPLFTTFSSIGPTIRTNMYEELQNPLNDNSQMLSHNFKRSQMLSAKTKQQQNNL